MRNRTKILSNSRQATNKQEELPTAIRLASLRNELQTAQLELEIQTDELYMSALILEKERIKFADFFDLAPTGYFILDQLGKVIDANRIGLELLSVEKSKLLNQKLHSFVASAELKKFSHFLYGLGTANVRKEIEVELKQGNAAQRYVKMEGMAVYNTEAQLVNYYVTMTDMTSTKLEQQKLQVITERLGISLKASSTGTWSIDLSEGTVALDEFSLSLLELDADEFDNSLRQFLELVHPDDRNMVKAHLLSDSSQQEKIDIEFRIFTKNKKIKYFITKGHRFSTELQKQFSIGIILDITNRRQIDLAKQELEDEKQKLVLATTFKAQEDERQKISSALHDSICQLLYGIKLNLQGMHLGSETANELRVINQLLEQAIKETRELSYELTPSILRDFGFVEGIREMAQRLSSKNFHVSTKLREKANQLPTDIQLSVFRVIQELLNNCIKHANADKVEVLVCTENEWVTIIVKDNGKGFGGDVEALMAKGSGLRGIRNRISLLDGTLDFETGSSGTQITVCFKNDGHENIGIGLNN